MKNIEMDLIRNFRLVRRLYLVIFILLSLWIGACNHASPETITSDTDLPVIIEPILINQLGNEHFGNAIYRRGINGPRIAASGNRILEWPVQISAPTTELVPPTPESYQNGACSMDINGDNIDEMIVSRASLQQGTDLLWYEELPGQTQWKEHFIANIWQRDGEEGFHDIMPFEMMTENISVRGVAVVVNRKTLYWFEIPKDFTQQWKQHLISDMSKQGAEHAQSGLVLGDLAGNGRHDIVCGNFWAECPADPTTDLWQLHRYSEWDRKTIRHVSGVPDWVNETRFGGMNQLELGDMDGDGTLDIIATDAEIPDGRIGIFCRDVAKPRELWKENIIDTGIYCPHSLVVTDINADNRPDIIVGEMTAGGWWFPRNMNPRLYLYLNQDSLKFRKYVIHEGWGIHMMRMAPDQPNTQIFLFGSDEIQSWYKDMNTHIVGWIIHNKK